MLSVVGLGALPLETDGSTVAVGEVLKQKFNDTNLKHPVGFFSRTLTGSERNY